MVGWDGWLPSRETVRHYTFEDSHTTVVEKRAPTDESVRLLREMEQAAKDKLLNSLRLEGNRFEAVVALDMSLIRGEMTASCIFDFNGHRFEAEASASIAERTADKYAVVHKLRQKVAEMIAGEALAEAFMPLIREFDR